MPSAFLKLQNLVKELGVADAGIYLFTTLCHKLTGRTFAHRYHLLAQPVPKTPGKLLQRNRKFQFREITAEQYQPEWFPPPMSFIQQRFDQNAHCIVAFDDDQPAACIWLALDGYIEDEVRCRFLPLPANRTAWDFDVYVKPEYKLSRCFAYLWDYANCWLRERNVDWCMSRINAFNPASLTAHKRLGAKIVGNTAFFHLGPLQLTFRDAHSRAVAIKKSQQRMLNLSIHSVPEVCIDTPNSQ